jgi:2-phosphosulfolactate phosphatase
MDPFDQQPFQARMAWEPRGMLRAADRGDVVIVVDVLSFGTAVCMAVERGIRIVPVAPGPEGAEVASKRGAVLAVRREEGEPSLSPQSFGNVASGSVVVLPSPNGSACAAAAEAGTPVFVACLRNATAVAKAASALGKPVTVIAAGERWEDGALRVAVEDMLGAGAVLAALPGAQSPEAQSAVAAFEAAKGTLHKYLSECGSGRELTERGYTGDIDCAAELDVSTVAPRLVEGEFTS